MVCVDQVLDVVSVGLQNQACLAMKQDWRLSFIKSLRHSTPTRSTNPVSLPAGHLQPVSGFHSGVEAHELVGSRRGKHACMGTRRTDVLED